MMYYNILHTYIIFTVIYENSYVYCQDIIEDFEFITVISTIEDDITISQAAEQQNEVPVTSESEASDYPIAEDYTVSSEVVGMETPSMETNSDPGQSVFNMWLHLHQGYTKQKTKERFCIDKMAACLADASASSTEYIQNDNDLRVSDLIPEPNNFAPVFVTKETTVPPIKQTEDITPTVTKATEDFTNPSSVITTTVSNNVRCNTQNFMRLRECCPHTPGDLITGAIVFACAEGSPVVPRSLLREYSLNLGQSDDKSVNFTSTRTFSGQLLGGSVCFTDCIFRKRAMVNNEGDLDYSIIRYHLTKAVSGAWQLAMLQAIDTCGKAIKFVHPERKMYRSRSITDYCLVHPFLLFQCIRKSLILACVSMSIQEKDPECTNKLENLKACDIFKIPQL